LIYIDDYNISCITNKNPTKIQPLLEHDQPTDGQVYKKTRQTTPLLQDLNVST